MKKHEVYYAEDGKWFASEADCERYEIDNGYSGPVADFLDAEGYEGRSRTTARKTLVAFLAWRRAPAAGLSEILDPAGDDEAAD